MSFKSYVMYLFVQSSFFCVFPPFSREDHPLSYRVRLCVLFQGLLLTFAVAGFNRSGKQASELILAIFQFLFAQLFLNLTRLTSKLHDKRNKWYYFTGFLAVVLFILSLIFLILGFAVGTNGGDENPADVIVLGILAWIISTFAFEPAINTLRYLCKKK